MELITRPAVRTFALSMTTPGKAVVATFSSRPVRHSQDGDGGKGLNAGSLARTAWEALQYPFYATERGLKCAKPKERLPIARIHAKLNLSN
ncbi:MAG: hypothetical protein JO025_25665 [Verrucomicrobia bacterium]|nr:hypothetical protein [Verrucomicrobiota bacterium]